MNKIITAAIIATVSSNVYAVYDKSDALSAMKSAANQAQSSGFSDNFAKDLLQKREAASESVVKKAATVESLDPSKINDKLDSITTYDERAKAIEEAKTLVENSENALRAEIKSGKLSSTSSTSYSAGFPWAGKSFTVTGYNWDKSRSQTYKVTFDSMGYPSGKPVFSKSYSIKLRNPSKSRFPNRYYQSIENKAVGKVTFTATSSGSIRASSRGSYTISRGVCDGDTTYTIGRDVMYSVRNGKITLVGDEPYWNTRTKYNSPMHYMCDD